MVIFVQNDRRNNPTIMHQTDSRSVHCSLPNLADRESWRYQKNARKKVWHHRLLPSRIQKVIHPLPIRVWCLKWIVGWSLICSRVQNLFESKIPVVYLFINETNMLLNNIQENVNNFGNMEFHTTIKKQIIIVWKIWWIYRIFFLLSIFGVCCTNAIDILKLSNFFWFLFHSHSVFSWSH